MAAGHLTQREESGWQEDSLARRAFGDGRICVLMSQMENSSLNQEEDLSRQQAGLRWNRNAGLQAFWPVLGPISANLSLKPQANGELSTFQSGPAPCVHGGGVSSSVLTSRVPPRSRWGTADPQCGPSLHPCSRPALRKPGCRVNSRDACPWAHGSFCLWAVPVGWGRPRTCY